MVLQKKRINAAYGYLNEGVTPNEFELFIIVPVDEGKTAIFHEEQYFASGLTLLNIEIVEDEEKMTNGYACNHVALRPAVADSGFDPNTGALRMVVVDGSDAIVSELYYKDADKVRIDTADWIGTVLYNTAYVHLAEVPDHDGEMMLAPRVLVPVKGFYPTLMEQVVESTGNGSFRAVAVLTPDETVQDKILCPVELNELEYPVSGSLEGHFLLISVKAENEDEAENLLLNAILDRMDEAQENKTRKGRVRKRRTATRAQDGDQNGNDPKPVEKKEADKTPPRKGKVRKKYTRTRDLEPIVKPDEE